MNVVTLSGQLEEKVTAYQLDEKRLKVTGNLLVGHERGHNKIPFVAFNKTAQKLLGVTANEKVVVDGKV